MRPFDRDGAVIINNERITHLHFADYTNLFATKEEKLEELLKKVDNTQLGLIYYKNYTTIIFMDKSNALEGINVHDKIGSVDSLIYFGFRKRIRLAKSELTKMNLLQNNVFCNIATEQTLLRC